MIVLNLRVIAQGIEVLSSSELVSRSVNIYDAVFEFNSDWEGFTKTVVYQLNSNPDPVEIVMTGDTCVVPPEAVEVHGILRIGVYGTNGTQVMPTVWTNALLVKEGTTTGSVYIEPTETTYEQVMELLAGIGGGRDGQILAKLSDIDYDFKWVDNPARYVDGEPGNIVVIDNNNNIADSGKSLSDIYDAAMISKTASGAIVTITDGADGVPLKSMTVQIEPVQAGSGDPSPSNVRAISGWTAGTIYRTGKNLVDALHDDVISASGYTNYTYSQGVCTVTGNTLFGIVVPVRSGVEYTFSLFKGDSTNNINLRVREYSAKPTSLNDVSYIGMPINNGFSATQRCSVSYTPSELTNWVWFGFFRNGVPTGGSLTISEFQIEAGNSFTEYTPFVSRSTYEITFPSEAGTVYGGELTVNEDGTGTLTASYAKHTFTGQETLSGTVSGGINFNTAYWGTSLTMKPGTYYTDDKVKVSELPKVNVSTGLGMLIGANNHYMYIYHADQISGVTDIDTFRTWLTGLEVTYPLNVPVIYQLTAPQVNTLLGLNNIWADTGDIAVEYHADPTIFVDEKTRATKESIAHVEDGYTASQPYAVGESLYVGNTLYEVISAIASGGTITVGTNVQEAPVANQLSALKDWESATVTRNSSYLSIAATYCLVNRKLKLAILFGWFNVSTVPSSGATLLTISGIKPYNNYVYTYAHKGESIISLRSNTSSGNLTLSTDSGTTANIVTGAYALQIAIIPIQ